MEPKGLPGWADVSGRDTPPTAPEMTIGPDTMPLTLKVPGKSGGVIGRQRDEGKEGVQFGVFQQRENAPKQSRERGEKSYISAG